MALLTRAELADRLGVSYKVAGKLMLSMPTILIGKRERVDEADLSDWISAQRRDPVPAVYSSPKLSLVTSTRLDPAGKIPARRKAG